MIDFVYRILNMAIRQELSVSDSKDKERIPSRYGVITIRPAGGQSPAGLSAAWGLAARRA
jgi:hypothetical protein